MTVIPRGNFLGCTYYLVPHELTNEQLLAGMHLKWGGGVYEVLKYKRMCGMAHDKPELESYAYTYVINKRLQKTLATHEAQKAVEILKNKLYMYVKCGLQSAWNTTEKLVRELIVRGTMTREEVFGVVGNLRESHPVRRSDEDV